MIKETTNLSFPCWSRRAGLLCPSAHFPTRKTRKEFSSCANILKISILAIIKTKKSRSFKGTDFWGIVYLFCYTPFSKLMLYITFVRTFADSFSKNALPILHSNVLSANPVSLRRSVWSVPCNSSVPLAFPVRAINYTSKSYYITITIASLHFWTLIAYILQWPFRMLFSLNQFVV